MATTLPILPNTGSTGHLLPTLSPGQGIGASTLPISPAAPASTGIGVPTTGISAGLNTADGSNTLTGDFKDTYGSGTGKALAGVLGGLGTATDAAVTSTNQGILDAAGRQVSNLQATNAAHGVSADSSSAALGLGDFNSQVSQTIASTDSQMELQEENTLISSLQGEGAAHGADSSFWDSLGDVFGVVGDVADTIGSAVTGMPASGHSILDTLRDL